MSSVLYVFGSISRDETGKRLLSCLSISPLRCASPLSVRRSVDTGCVELETSTRGSTLERGRGPRPSPRHRVRRRCAVTVLCGSVASFRLFPKRKGFRFCGHGDTQITKLLFMNMRMSASRLYLLFEVVPARHYLAALLLELFRPHTCLDLLVLLLLCFAPDW